MKYFLILMVVLAGTMINSNVLEAKTQKKIIGKSYPYQCFYQVPLDKFLSGNYTMEDLRQGQKDCLSKRFFN